jgi:uncharacterized membrane protein YtjA (UPF0391 family)
MAYVVGLFSFWSVLLFVADFLHKDTLSAVWPASVALLHTLPSHFCSGSKGGFAMLRWALIFFTVALLAAVLGFSGIAVAAAGVARVLFFLFVVLLLITLLGHVARRQ